MTIPSMNAGWYPAPDGSGQTWWWDGAQWTPPQREASPVPPADPAARKSVAGLAVATQVLLAVSAASALATIAAEIFGIASASSYLGGSYAAIDAIDAYDRITIAVAIFSVVALVATGVVWAIWQHRVARLAIGRTRRTPGWHAWSWFIPVVALWFPLQNISDLWRGSGRAQPAWLGGWWALWILSNIASSIANRVSLNATTLDQYIVAMVASLASALFLLGAAPFAVQIVRGLTNAYK